MSAGNVPFNTGGPQGNVPFNQGPAPNQMPSGMRDANYGGQGYYPPQEYQQPPPGYSSYGPPPPEYQPPYDMKKNSELTGSHEDSAEVRKHKLTTRGVVMLILGPGILFYFAGFGTAVIFLDPLVRIFTAVRNEISLIGAAYILWPGIKSFIKRLVLR